jgi:tetratricopeptide (TPR) repeat protein
MEQMATPGTILITEHTQKLTEGYFDLKALGTAEIKGMEAPLSIYEVVGAGPLRTRLQVSARRGLTRFIGRQSEMVQLQRALEQATAGHGQIVGVMGEPGMGKSRLFYEFKFTSQSGGLVLEAYSLSYGKASPYLPLIELLKSYFAISVEDDDRKRREKVGGKVLMLDRSLEDTLPYLFALLSIDDPTSSLHQMDPQIRRRRTFDALKNLFLRESLNQPLLLIFEDLHWIDNETQGFLDVLSESVASVRILVLVNYRPEYRHEWGQKTYYTQLRLAPLGKEEADELLTFLLGSAVSLKTLKQLVLDKTEGTPFFMEEVVQTLVEEGVLVGERGHYRLEKAPTALHLSPTVQGVLAARIDRLAAAEKDLLQQLAVIGREFPVSLVRQVVTQPEEELYRILSSLQRKEFVYEQPAFPEVEYLFKHALTQEVAYSSVLQARRKALHEHTAKAIEDLYRANLDDHYSELAHHYSRSGNAPKAVEYLQRAGHQAMQRSANVEAINHLSAALEVLKTLPDTPERAQQELALQLSLGSALMTTKGYAAPEIQEAYSRARDLCHQLGETPQLFPVLWGLYTVYVNRGELRTAHEVAEQLLPLARRVQDPTLLLEAHRALGETLYWRGEFVSAREQQEQGIPLYDPLRHSSHAFLYAGTDPQVQCQSFAAWALWHLGYPDQALQRIDDALTLAQQFSHFHSLAFALGFAARLHQFRREEQLARERAEAVMTLATEQGFPFWLAVGMGVRGWTLAEQGQMEEGIAQMRQSRTSFLAPYALAEAYGKVGQVEKGLTVLAKALAFVEKTGMRVNEAELYRLKGELLLAQEVCGLPAVGFREKTEKAEECFQKAIEIAQRQQAKSLELRAVISLSRLWQQQGKRTEAHQMLTETYSWFTEGFDTKDLQEAKALLEELT